MIYTLVESVGVSVAAWSAEGAAKKEGASWSASRGPLISSNLGRGGGHDKDHGHALVHALQLQLGGVELEALDIVSDGLALEDAGDRVTEVPCRQHSATVADALANIGDRHRHTEAAACGTRQR